MTFKKMFFFLLLSKEKKFVTFTCNNVYGRTGRKLGKNNSLHPLAVKSTFFKNIIPIVNEY